MTAMTNPQGEMFNAKTITDIRENLLSVFNGLRSGTLQAKDVVEINNTAGKIISSVKVQLAYHAMRQERPEIPFLDSPPTTKTLDHKKDNGGDGEAVPT